VPSGECAGGEHGKFDARGHCRIELIQGELESGLEKGPDDEAQEAHGRADHCDPEGTRGWREDSRSVPQARDQLRCALPTASLRGPPPPPPNRASPTTRLQSSLDKNWGQRHRKAWRNSSPAQGIRILKAIRIFSGAAGGATAAHQYRQRRWSRRNATLPGRPEKLSNYNARK
jgi:hypothetical protein